MERLIKALDTYLQSVASAGSVVIFLDYDGTITPIVERPETANLAGNARAIIERLASHPRCTVSIISGRTLADVMKRVAVANVVYFGNHGLECSTPALQPILPVAILPLMESIQMRLAHVLSEYTEIIIEDKTLSLSVHYRMVAPEIKPRILAAVETCSAPEIQKGMVLLRSGKEVLEVRPATAWGKGNAALALLDTIVSAGRQPVVFYFGDDETDEDAFSALGTTAVTVRVGASKASTARYYVSDTEETITILCALARALEET